MSITAGSARNVWKHHSRKDHNVRREGSNISNSNHSRDSRDETTAVRTHQQQDRQQHKKQLEQREMPTTAGDANNSRDEKTRGNISRRRDVNISWNTTAGTPGRLTGQHKELPKQKG
jgi:hypothetical protein